MIHPQPIIYAKLIMSFTFCYPIWSFKQYFARSKWPNDGSVDKPARWRWLASGAPDPHKVIRLTCFTSIDSSALKQVLNPILPQMEMVSRIIGGKARAQDESETWPAAAD